MRSARNLRRSLELSLPTAVAVSVLCAPIPSSGQPAASKEDAALAAVRKELQALQSRLTRQATQRNEDAQALRDIELSIAASAQELTAVRADFREQQARQSAVAQETLHAKEQLDAERETLAR